MKISGTSLLRKILTATLMSLCFTAFAETYQIKEVKYNVTPCSWAFLGATKPYAINQNVDIDKDVIFESIEEVDKYIADYKQRLKNLRAFDSIDVKYTIGETLNEEGNYPITIISDVVDSMHFLGMPYGKYNSNSGTSFKLKVKDSNFLGTLNPLNGELTFSLEQANEQADIEYSFGTNFSFDYPFHAGIFDIVWINSHSFSYTIGNELPEWNFKTGVKFVLPKDKYSLSLELDQFIVHDLDYAGYGDEFYYKELANFSVPIKIFNIDGWGKVYYTPYTQFDYCWDKDGISNLKYNYSLEGPNLTVGHKLTTSRINWKQNLRTGASFNLTNTYKYNLDRKITYPLISAEIKAFKRFNLYDGNWFSRFGICADLYTFTYLNNYDNTWQRWDGATIGARMRGIRDSQYYMNGTKNTWWSSVRNNTATVLNLDMPVHIFETNFKNKYLKYFNFDLQFSPFMDISLGYNKYTKTWYDPKDGFYAAGLEVLVYPKKFSNYTVRGSIGVDVGRLLLSDYINMDWRQQVSKYEITVGLGLHY